MDCGVEEVWELSSLMRWHPSKIEQAISVARARHVASDVTPIWQRQITWKRPETWFDPLTSWLAPRLRDRAMERLKPGQFRELCWDDEEWLDVLQECLVSDLDNDLMALAAAMSDAVLRVYHGCRTDNVGSYFDHGLLIHDRAAMTSKVYAIIESTPSLSWMKGQVETAISEVGNSLDIGKLYVVGDDTVLLTRAAHYLIYGSEWITAVLGETGRHTLLSHGLPTLLEIDLPLRMVGVEFRVAFGRHMLAEWSRLACNQSDWSAPIDFTFILREEIPPRCIVGHSHPPELRNPFDRSMYRTINPTCAYCLKA